MSGFLIDSDLLQEDSNTEDLLNFSNEIQKFDKKIHSIKKPSIVGLVGRFGIGKSTMLYQLRKKLENTVKWIEFDAWKFPERDNLWEGFVLEYSRQINEKAFNQARKQIDGTQKSDVRTLMNTIGDIPGLAVIKNLNHFFRTSPARRVFEIQEILLQQIKTIKQPLIIEIEDIDRSGDAGVFFLETLQQFIRSNYLNTPVIVIVPISEDSYYKNLESYLKCVDYFEFFKPSSIKLDNFVDRTFDNELFKGSKNYTNGQLIWTGEARRSQIINLLEELFIQEPSMTMRLLKTILRKSNILFEQQFVDGYDPDFRLTICFEASKYFKAKDSQETHFDQFIREKKIQSTTVYASFIACMHQNYNSMYIDGQYGRQLIRSKNNIEFVTRPTDEQGKQFPSWPWYHQDMFETSKNGYKVCDYYLDY